MNFKHQCHVSLAQGLCILLSCYSAFKCFCGVLKFLKCVMAVTNPRRCASFKFTAFVLLKMQGCNLLLSLQIFG